MGAYTLTGKGVGAAVEASLFDQVLNTTMMNRCRFCPLMFSPLLAFCDTGLFIVLLGVNKVGAKQNPQLITLDRASW